MAIPVGTDIVKLIQGILDLIGGEKEGEAPTGTPGAPVPSPYLPSVPTAPTRTPEAPPHMPGVTPETLPSPTANGRYPYYRLPQVNPPVMGGVGGGPYYVPPEPEVERKESVKPTITEKVTAKPTTKAAPTKDKSWEQRFYDEHGRYPNQKDRMDREWSEQHAGLHGRPPTEDEWKWNYFNPNPDLMKKYFPQYGGGGYYAQTRPDVEVPEPLGELSWWGPSGAPPMLRPWSTWLQEMVEANRLTPVAFPFDIDEAAETAEAQELEETEGIFPVEGYTSTRGVLERIQGLLGLEYGEEATPTEKWQAFINVLPEADFEAQQLLASLRYEPDREWYTVDIGQLVNPRYL